jgi:hypothetical protein
VRWAEAIRAGYLAVMAKRVRDVNEALMHSRTLRGREKDELCEMDRLHDWIRGQVAASWWIERRGKSYQRFEWDALHEMKRV